MASVRGVVERATLEARNQLSPVKRRLIVLTALSLAAGQPSGAQRNVSYQLSPAPLVLVGESRRVLEIQDGADAEFSRVISIVDNPFGGFVVANRGTRAILFINARGQVVRRAGGRGGGPGEFEDISALVSLGTAGIAVLDAIARRVSIFDRPGGTYLRSFLLTPPFAGGGTPLGMIGLGDSTLLIGFSEIQTMAPAPEARAFTQRLFQYSADGRLLTPQGQPRFASEHFVQAVAPQAGGVAYWNLAFGRVMTLRAAPQGFFAGDGSGMFVEQLNAAGLVVARHEVPWMARPVSADDRRRFRASVLSSAPAARRAMLEKMVDEMPFPRSKPAYRRFEVSPGRLWLEVYPDSQESPTDWLRLDMTSRVATRIRFPAGFRPMFFTDSLAAGIAQDADGVERLQAYRLPR
jgi:hypothetical protein